MEEQEKIRGTEYAYSSFLWRNIFAIRGEQARGNHIGGLYLATTLIDYLPIGIQDKFLKKANTIMLACGIMRKLSKASDIFTTALSENRNLQKFTKPLLRDFMRDLCNELDRRDGYMEKGGVQPTFRDKRKLTFDK